MYALHRDQLMRSVFKRYRSDGIVDAPDMFELKILFLFLATAVAEIIGCYLPYLWLNKGQSAWLLIPAAASLALFAWLLTLHPTAAGRTYAAYGGVYIFVAILWLWAVDGVRPTAWDVAGSLVALAGMGIIMFGPKHA
jgi:small multidrug resistance family-3 protein